MTKHLADHRATSTGTRVKQFLRLAHQRGETMWKGLWQKPVPQADSNRRVLEYVRIERGRRV